MLLRACSPTMTRSASHEAASTSAAAGRDGTSEAPQSLFVFPLESNFSGARYDVGESKQQQS